MSKPFNYGEGIILQTLSNETIVFRVANDISHIKLINDSQGKLYEITLFVRGCDRCYKLVEAEAEEFLKWWQG